MIKKQHDIWRTLVCSIVLLSEVVLAHGKNNNAYIELKLGPCIPKKTDGFKFRTTANATFELGYKYDSWRLGLQVGYTQFDVKNNDGTRLHFFSDIVKARSYVITSMFDLYRDFQIKEQWKCYVGLGIGYIRYRVFTKSTLGDITSDSKNFLGEQGIVGLSYDITSSFTFCIDYRCIRIPNGYVKDNGLGIYNNKLASPLLHTIQFGLRYNF